MTIEKMDLRGIAAGWLVCHGYDGLFHPDAECGCKLDNLMPCDEPSDTCRPGYLAPCPGPESETCEGDCKFHIVAARLKAERKTTNGRT